MGSYAETIQVLKLYQALKKSIGNDQMRQSDVDTLAGMVAAVADGVGPDLEVVSRLFSQYTEHSIIHCRNVIDLMGRFIPHSTLAQLNGLEIALLMLTGLLHDAGMIVAANEKNDAICSPAFAQFRDEYPDYQEEIENNRRHGANARAQIIEDCLLAEFFRRVHPERARVYVDNVLGPVHGINLEFQGVNLKSRVATLCESHGWGVGESRDPFDLSKAVSNLSTCDPVNGVPCNDRYIACCLRLADILDFDRSRTPPGVFKHIDFTEQTSWLEWNKHLQVRGWSIDEHTVAYSVLCSHPAFYVAVQEFLGAIDRELQDCGYLVDGMPARFADRYRILLPRAVDRRNVRMENPRYVAGGFRFSLEYDEIMRLLMDRSLYPDPDLFLRELLQNSLDACRHKEALAAEVGKKRLYVPRIAVWDRTDDTDDPRVVFQDNGTGMNVRLVQEFFMRVGRSYYRSSEFRGFRERLRRAGLDVEACSHFGIGILSCFLVGHRIEIETYKHGFIPLRVFIEGPSKFFVIETLPGAQVLEFQPSPRSDADDGPPHIPGTRVTVHIRPRTSVAVTETLRRFAANADFNIRVHSSNRKRPTIVRSFKWSNLPLVVPKDIGDMHRNVHCEDILTPSRIPFEKWEFSRDIRGKAWLWLLRGGEGSPCWERGYFRMEQALRLEGAFVHGLEDIGEVLLSRVSARSQALALAHLRQLVQGRKSPPSPPPELVSLPGKELSLFERMDRFMYESWMRDLDSREKKCILSLLEKWERILREDPRLISQYCRTQLRPSIISGRVARALLTKDYRSLDALPPNVSGNITWNRYDEGVALHGILVPNGVTYWNPSEVKAFRYRLLKVPAAVFLDGRRSCAPKPVASRLFVLADQAGSLLVPFFRAVVHHVMEIPNVGQETAWRRWMYWLLGGDYGERRFLDDCMKIEMKLIEAHVRYAAVLDGTETLVTRSELLRHFGGPWVPAGVHQRGIRLRADVPRRERRSRKAWLDLDDGLTQRLVSVRPVKRGSDGAVVAVSLEGFAEKSWYRP